MTRRHRDRTRLRDAMLDQEQNLYDLRAALAALSLIASVPDGVETDDMPGLRFVARIARDLANSLHHAWRDALEQLGPPSRTEGDR